MASFATVEDLEAFLDETFDESAGSAQAQAMLDAATAEMKTLMGGQNIDVPPTADTIQLDADGRYMLRLPQRPVTAVSAVTVNTTTATVLTVSTDVEWHADGRIYRVDGLAWGAPRWPGRPRQFVTVTYTHGYAQMPEPLMEICRQYAARKLENPTNAVRDSAGAVSEQYSVGFTDAEEAVLRDFGGVLVG